MVSKSETDGRSSGREVFSTGSTIPEKRIKRPVDPYSLLCAYENISIVYAQYKFYIYYYLLLVLVQLRDKRTTQEEAIIWPRAISLLPLRTCILTMCTIMERALGNTKQDQPGVSYEQTEFRIKETTLYYLPQPNSRKYPILPRRVVHVIN